MTQSDFSIAAKTKSGKKPPAALVFFQRWMANPMSMGSVTPSGPGLKRLVRENVICGPDQIVVEFGPGTGPITGALLEHGIPGEKIYCFEIDENLASYLHGTFPDVNVVVGDCREVEKRLPQQFLGNVGTVVVGIPMVMLPHKTQQEIVDAIFRVMPEGARFLLYTYCFSSPLDMKALGLKGHRLGWTPKNIPPASVWAYWRA